MIADITVSVEQMFQCFSALLLVILCSCTVCLMSIKQPLFCLM